MHELSTRIVEVLQRKLRSSCLRFLFFGAALPISALRVLFEAAEVVKRWTRASLVDLVEGVGRRELEACEVEARVTAVSAEVYYSPDGNTIRHSYLERTQALLQATRRSQVELRLETPGHDRPEQHLRGAATSY